MFKFKPTDPQEAMLKSIRNNPAFQLLLDSKFNEASEEAYRILEEGSVNASWTDKAIWQVSPQVFKVKVHGQRVSCPCEFFKTWGFCSHALAVDLKRGKENV